MCERERDRGREREREGASERARGREAERERERQREGARGRESAPLKDVQVHELLSEHVHMTDQGVGQVLPQALCHLQASFDYQ